MSPPDNIPIFLNYGPGLYSYIPIFPERWQRLYSYIPIFLRYREAVRVLSSSAGVSGSRSGAASAAGAANSGSSAGSSGRRKRTIEIDDDDEDGADQYGVMPLGASSLLHYGITPTDSSNTDVTMRFLVENYP
jgi:hypothetical protein